MSNIYRSATLKLTVWYLLLVVAISLIFSGVVYHVGTHSLAQGLTNQQARIYQAFPVFNNDPFFIHKTDISDGARDLLLNLLYFNIAVFIGAGFASYWLARRTLEPIRISNEQQKRFVADASHELRTPLTTLKMSSEVTLMDSAATKEDLRSALQSNLEDIDRLNTLLNNLLKLSQLESHELRHTFAQLTLSQLAEQARGQVKGRAAKKHIVIHDETTDSTIMGNHDSMVQLLVILLDNAIKYSPEHTTISITSVHDHHTTTLTIADHGVGIKPEALTHVFDRFYRADTSRTGNEGYGLGLSIAKHIADMHHGSISLTSRPGKGTTARIELPNEII